MEATQDLGDIRVPFSQADRQPMPEDWYRMQVQEYTIGKAKNPPKDSPPGTSPNTVVNVTFLVDPQQHPNFDGRNLWRTYAVTARAYFFLREFLTTAGLPAAMLEEDEQQDPTTGVIKRVPRYTLRQQVEYIKGKYLLCHAKIVEYTTDNPDGSKEVKHRNEIDEIKAAA